MELLSRGYRVEITGFLGKIEEVGTLATAWLSANVLIELVVWLSVLIEHETRHPE